MNRRSFVGAALSAMTGAALRTGSADARLNVRPRSPDLPAVPGETQLGPNLRRGALLYVPERYESSDPAPLVVALHGNGGGAAQWRRWYPVCEARGMVLVAPDSRARTWDRVYGAFGDDVRFVESALRHTFRRCAVDAERIALMGFSDGASYALSLGPSNGDLFSHLMAFSPGFSRPAEPIVGRPRVFISHGDEDPVLPVAGVRDGIAPMFEMDGYDTTYAEFSGGHEMPEAVVRKALDWFVR